MPTKLAKILTIWSFSYTAGIPPYESPGAVSKEAASPPRNATMPFSLARVISSVSVRTRIIGLAVIPVLGFIATGMAFRSGQPEVTQAFANVGTAAVLADASREFKFALATMQIAAKDFV